MSPPYVPRQKSSGKKQHVLGGGRFARLGDLKKRGQEAAIRVEEEA